MEEQKLGEEPAFPINDDAILYHGVSKRFYAACSAMQGILSMVTMNGVGGFKAPNYEAVIRESYKAADELLKQENG